MPGDNECFKIFIIWKMSHSKIQGHFSIIYWDIFQIIEILKESLWTEFFPDIHDISTNFFRKARNIQPYIDF